MQPSSSETNVEYLTMFKHIFELFCFTVKHVSHAPIIQYYRDSGRQECKVNLVENTRIT